MGRCPSTTPTPCAPVTALERPKARQLLRPHRRHGQRPGRWPDQRRARHPRRGAPWLRASSPCTKRPRRSGSPTSASARPGRCSSKTAALPRPFLGRQVGTAPRSSSGKPSASGPAAGDTAPSVTVLHAGGRAPRRRQLEEDQGMKVFADVFQDGRDFYDEAATATCSSAPFPVRDFDMEAAQDAREAFLAWVTSSTATKCIGAKHHERRRDRRPGRKRGRANGHRTGDRRGAGRDGRRHGICSTRLR